ncbi:MAG TPA: S8 family serine peptidase [Candidatus Deferrimicrobium sp.]|nr:S8 family serine peptidase [Candidatus Deferrimicrobium sp.]
MQILFKKVGNNKSETQSSFQYYFDPVIISGVCWDAKIMAIKTFRPTTPQTYLYLSDEIEAFEYIVKMKTMYDVNIAAINCSFGGASFSGLEQDIIEEAGNAGIIMCAAAGNGGDDGLGDNDDQVPEYPASYILPNIISVAATTLRTN